MCARGLLSVTKMVIRDDKQQITRRKIALPDDRTTDWSNVAPERHRFRGKDQNASGPHGGRTLQQ